MALVALAGVPATGVAAAKVLGGGGERADTATAAAKQVVALEPAATAKPRQRDARRQFADLPARTRPAGERPSVARSSNATVPRPDVRKIAARRPAGIPELQRALAVPVDGDFGPRTARALERWQRAHGIAADGVAGPQTREALGLGPGQLLRRERPAKRRHARRGHRAVPARATAARHGGGVRGLQRALGLGADGVFGPTTEKALERWQRAHGLTADGVAGPQTRRKLGMAQGPVLKRRGGGRRRRHSGGGGGSSTGGGGSSSRGGGSSGGGGGSSTVQRVIAAANRIASKPYVYGGGHGSFDAPGYDCSGSVSYALHGGGLLSAPLDSSGFMSYGAPGAGRHITIYANPGHVYMTIDGRRFDTSARSQTGSRWSGSGRGGGGYTVRHPSGL